ncbi:MAG: Ldh family oxidoreductase [Nitrospinae bacterium]|nr:Ldh family oxidoreductase [Nitrospinota bacterium]
MSGHTTGEKLHVFLHRAFSKLGMPDEDAAWTADTLVTAELRGVTSHGVIRMPHYARRLEVKLANPAPDFRIIKDAGALALADGDNGMGQVVSKRAMEEAIARARTHNVGVVLLKESNHFGAAATYAAMAPEAGMVGLVTTNTLRVLPPAGGKEPKIGNNPVSIALPSDPPMVLDMALSVVARGYIIEAARAGELIPEGWGLDNEGRPTTDPHQVLESSLLSPIAGYKGSGLSIAIDAILGSLAGGGHSHEIVGINEFHGKSRVTSVFAAINVESLLPISQFRASANAFISIIKATPKAAGVETIFMPGEIEHQSETKRRRDGFELSPERLAELDEIAQRLDLPPLERGQ